MSKIIPFTIYDAAAGSGKTFTLVKEYLKIIIQASNEGYYKYILAITFTNKAVTEMKQRIIKNLCDFKKDDLLDKPTDMAIQIAKETGLNLIQIQKQSSKVLKHLLHNYSSFSVETIDSFNHRLIRTFSKDLKLTGNFEVSLDTAKLNAEAVDKLISKAGENSKTTKVLIDFALEKTDDDKSWDISRDFFNTSEMLFNENDLFHINKLRDKTLDDFSIFINQLLSEKKEISSNLRKKASDLLQRMEESGLQFESFNGSYFPTFMAKIALGDFMVNLNTKWQEQLGQKPLYPVRVLKDTPELAAIIDELEPLLINVFEAIKTEIPRVLLVESLLKNSTPLSIINLVNQEVEILKEEQNMLPISEFNQIINKEIKNQPAPFIYERMGERYRHFFIDEFQDTSLLQWQNLIPLIENAITQQYQDGVQGSLLLVGDAKQSIYRWRGGVPEQFIELCNGENPFHIKELVNQLPTNFRSKKELVDFNNSFFTFISNYFGDPIHKKIYESGNHQMSINKEGGYVSLEFLEYKNAEESHEIYARKVYETILSIKENGYQEKDISILTRTKVQGISMGTYLIEKGITIVSSETLLLQHSPMVRFLIDCLKISLFPENEEVKISVLEFLHIHLTVSEEKHTFFISLLKTSLAFFSEKLKPYGITIDFAEIQSLSLYESFEYCIRKTRLDPIADAYLFAFMDLVYDFDQQTKASKILFLEDWEIQKEKAGIPISESVRGVKLLTIHKAKGLEFPIVIFPYADLNIYQEKMAKTWFPIDPIEYGFDEMLINFNKNVEAFGEAGKSIYNTRRNTLELDNFNLLYVTLTRAETQLFILSNKPSKVPDTPSSYNQLFAKYLKEIDLWEDTKSRYEFGSSQPFLSEYNKIEFTTKCPIFISTTPQDHNLKLNVGDALLWDTKKEDAIASGNLVHFAMEKIKYEGDLEFVLSEFENDSDISSEQIQELKKQLDLIVYHPRLNQYFNPIEKVFTERKIITTDGSVLIPDRINFIKNKSVVIIDYKTGEFHKKHENQISNYASALIEMGYLISEKILIYTKIDTIDLIYV